MKRTSWSSVRLGEIADFRNGLNYNKDNFGKGLKVVNVKDFQDRLIADLNGLDEINPHGVVREECYLKDGDIIFVRSNGNRELIGRSMLLKGVTERVSHSAFSIKVRFSTKDALPRFYAYVFRTELIRTELSNRGGGTNISNLNQDILESLQVPKPPLLIQHKIASLLSAYDDLIENNTRRIAILESMAQAIYREWFVEFRFPGHENVKLVDSPLGKVPEGWNKHLGDVITLKRGYDLPQRDRRSGIFPLVSSSGITDFHDEAKVTGPGVVTGRYGTLGDVYYIQKDFWPLNTTLYVQEFQGNEPLLIVHLLRSLNLASQNAAGAVPGVNRNALHLLEVTFPPLNLQKQIVPTIEAIECNCRNLRSTNENLRKTRDLLLPKLISGELDVEDLDIESIEPLVEAET